MIKYVIVLCELSKKKYFVQYNENYKVNDTVVFNVDSDSLIGKVLTDCRECNENDLELPLPSIIRVADKDDFKNFNANKEKADKALNDAKKYAKELELDMNFVDCYYTLNQNQLIFNFTADDRIDFRNLAKKLAGKYKTRIELRQIGVRDKAKRIGGIGPCGLFLCCNTFLTDFNSVSINMAKNQNLALNPSKINGLCGRLYCCLSYEDEVYSKLRKDLPEVGEIITKKGVKGKVISLDILNNKYRIETEDKGIIDLDG